MAITLTIFPGTSLEEVSIRGLGSKVLQWQLEDFLRAIFVCIISILPIKAWFVAVGVRGSLKREKKAADKIYYLTHRLLANRDYKQLVSFNENAYAAIYEKAGCYPKRSLQVNRLLHDIMAKSVQRRVEPTALLLQSCREYFASRVSQIYPYQKLSLQLGILMTFVGLAWAFSVSQLGEYTSGATNDIEPLLGALSLAFATSIAGLVSSIFVILFANSVRRYYISTLQSLEVMVDAVYSFGRQAPTDPRFIDQVDQVADAVRAHASRAESLVNETFELKEVIRTGFNSVAPLKLEYEKKISSLAEEQTALISGFNQYVDALNPEKVKDQLDNISSAGNKALENQLNQTANLLGKSEKIMAEQGQQIEKLIQLQARSAEEITSIRDQMHQLVEDTREFELLRRRHRSSNIARSFEKLKAFIYNFFGRFTNKKYQRKKKNSRSRNFEQFSMLEDKPLTKESRASKTDSVTESGVFDDLDQNDLL